MLGGIILVLVVDGIHLIDGIKGANVYLITGSHLFLVDTGLQGQERKICNYLTDIGINVSSLEGIVLTHHDVDHVGSAVAMQRQAKCSIYAHSLEIPYILGHSKRPGIKQSLPGITKLVFGKLKVPTEVIPLSDGILFDEWEVIHTPGHTPGHISLYRNGIAIVGDLFQGGKIRLAPGFFTWDLTTLKKSARNLTERPLRWILPGHGAATPASGHWLDALRKLI